MDLFFTFIAPAFFVLTWIAYDWLVTMSPWRGRTLSAAMEEERRRWLGVMATRDLRIVDTNILGGLQTGTAFFASTSLLAIGAAFTLLTSADQLRHLGGMFELVISQTRVPLEMKAVGLLLIFAYAFLKFGWAYRLFNYALVLLGAVPMPQDEVPEGDRRRAFDHTVAMNITAAREFNHGLRAFFVAIAYLGWFFGDLALVISTILIFTMMIRRQFFSAARAGLVNKPDTDQ